MNATALLDRHANPAAVPDVGGSLTLGEGDPMRHAGITCTVGRSRVRHAALLIPDRRAGMRLVPACGIGISSREPEGRVLPYVFSTVVTCGRSGCVGHASPPERAPRCPQLMLDFGIE